MTLFRRRSNAIDAMDSLGLTWVTPARNRLFFSRWESNPPFPRGTHDGAQIGHDGLPAEESLGLGGISNQPGRIAGTRRFNLHGNLTARDFANAVDHFKDGKTAPGSEVQKIRLAALAKVLQGADMRVSQIDDMNVISDRRSVRRRIVVAEDPDCPQFTKRRRNHIWDQVRFRFVPFSTLLRCAGSIEIAQRDELQSVGSVVGFEQALHEKFGPAVRIFRPLPALLADGNLFRVAIDSGGGRKYHAPHTRLHERAHERDTLRDIVLIILGWINDRFSHFDQAGKMDAGFQFVFAGDARHKGAIANFPLIEWGSIVKRGAVASGQIVQYDDPFPFCSEAFHRHTANVARATCYQNRHNFLTF